MNNLMRRAGIVAVLCVLLCLCLLVCSCNKKGGNDETTPAETDPVETPAETPAESDPPETDPPVVKVTYTVTVKNAAGEGIANVSVQLCEGTSCHPGTTDASGVATFELTEAVYQANINAAVAGYVVDTAAKYDFAEGETSLVITLEAEAPVVDDSVVDLKGEDFAYGYMGGVYGYVYYVGDFYYDFWFDEIVVDEVVAVTAGDSVVYTYEATADGGLEVLVAQGLGVKVNVKNITTGVELLPLSGEGSLKIPMTAGNTYEITVEYAKSEDVAYGIAAYADPDGSKEAPYCLIPGMVATEIVIPEGETVWCMLADNYLLIEDPSVKVTINGTIYAPDENGNIELYTTEPMMIGLSSSVADNEVVVYLTGSNAENPFTIEFSEFGNFEMVTPNAFVDTVYYRVMNDMPFATVTVSSSAGKVTAVELYSLLNGANEDVYDSNESENAAVVDVTGYAYLVVAVSDDAGIVQVAFEDTTPPAGSELNPLVMTGTTGTVSTSLMETHTVSGVNFMGYEYTYCYIYYTYAATADGTYTLSVSQIDGATGYGVTNDTNATCGYIAGEFGEDGSVSIENIKAGDVITFQISVGTAQLEAETDLTWTLTVPSAN